MVAMFNDIVEMQSSKNFLSTRYVVVFWYSGVGNSAVPKPS